MWISPFKWMQGVIEDVRRQYRVDDLNRLSDHLLDDIGLRRDQIDALRLRPARAPRETVRPVRRPVVRPTLQGCG